VTTSAEPEKLEALEKLGVKFERGQSGKITSVNLSGSHLDDALAEQLSQLAGLQHLVVSESSMSLAGWKAVGKLSGLQQLDLRGCAVDNEQLTAAVAGMPRLRALRLSGQNGLTNVDDDGLKVLAGCADLKALSVDGLWFTLDGLRSLSNNKELAELYAAGTSLDDEAAQLLSEFPKLKKLRLAQTGVGTAGLEALSRLALEDLDISECSQISDQSLEAVGKINSLKRLNLWRDSIDDEGVKHLANLKNLQWLNLDNTHITDAGLRHLSELKQLTFLHLGSTSVTDDGMPALVGLNALKDLKVTRTAVTDAGVEVILASNPGVDIQLVYIETP
jgi:Leucine-rich repeat (LRR) protein